MPLMNAFANECFLFWKPLLSFTSVYLRSVSQNPSVDTKLYQESVVVRVQPCVAVTATAPSVPHAPLGTGQFEQHGAVLRSDSEVVYTFPYYSAYPLGGL